MHLVSKWFFLAAIASSTTTFMASPTFSWPAARNVDLELVAPIAAAPLSSLTKFEDWIRGVFARIAGNCDVADDQIPLANIKCLEARRASLNDRRAGFAGDRELI